MSSREEGRTTLPGPGKRESKRDRELLDRIAASDSAALAELYDRHSAAIFALLSRILEDRDAAAAVLEEVFARLWTEGRSWDRSLSPFALLARTARQQALARAAGRERSREAKAAGGTDAELLRRAYFSAVTLEQLVHEYNMPLHSLRERISSAMVHLRSQLKQ